jgi:hypothetical protein
MSYNVCGAAALRWLHMTQRDIVIKDDCRIIGPDANKTDRQRQFRCPDSAPGRSRTFGGNGDD